MIVLHCTQWRIDGENDNWANILNSKRFQEKEKVSYQLLFTHFEPATQLRWGQMGTAQNISILRDLKATRKRQSCHKLL